MIGVLYESGEWSDSKLAAEIEACGQAAVLLDMEDPANEGRILSCDLLVSRVFASAAFRGHTLSLERMPRILAAAGRRGIPVLNPAAAHFYEVDKAAATEALAGAGLTTPRVYACGTPDALGDALSDAPCAEGLFTEGLSAEGLFAEGLAYPCVLKPNCGGRTTCTAIVRSPAEARSFLGGMPDIAFLAEEYIEPVEGFITRAEVIGGECVLVVKRSIAENGLSAYRFGSTYEHYLSPSAALLGDCARAARELSIEMGSFDVIENGGLRYFIDANAVSNVSEDCTDLFGLDLLKAYAEYIVERFEHLAPGLPGTRHDR